MGTTALLRTFESARAFDCLVQKVGKIERAIFTAHHTAGNAAAADVIAFVGSGVLRIGILSTRRAIRQMAVKGLNLIDPD